MLEFFAIVLSGLTLYPLLGTSLGILLAIYPSLNIRLKAAALMVLRPVLYTFIIGFLFFAMFGDEWGWVLALLIVVLLKEMFISTNRFLSQITIAGNEVIITYITSYLKPISISVSSNDTGIFILSPASRIIDYPSSLTINHDGEEKKFIILSKEIWKSAAMVQHAVLFAKQSN